MAKNLGIRETHCLFLRIDMHAYIYTETFWKDTKETTVITLGDLERLVRNFYFLHNTLLQYIFY